ncbi:hypothetical protein F4801DRAFT_557665, partial [Xylaria longipes]
MMMMMMRMRMMMTWVLGVPLCQEGSDVQSGGLHVGFAVSAVWFTHKRACIASRKLRILGPAGYMGYLDHQVLNSRLARPFAAARMI